MSLSIEENNKLEKIYEHRLLQNGIEEIELYEELTREILENNNVDCIPGLCMAMDDEAYECSAVECALEAILLLVLNSGDNVNRAMSKLMEGTRKMRAHGEEWATVLHLQFFRDEYLCASYIQYAQSAQSEEKEFIIDILSLIRDEIEPDDVDMDKIIEQIEKGDSN